MYNKLFSITDPVGNNAFSFEKRKNKEIYVPSLIEGDFSYVEIGNLPAFIEIDEDGDEKSYVGLKNFVKTVWQNIPVYIFDNHNHAFYFWHEAFVNGIIDKGINLVHIDEHHDTRESNINPDFDLTPRLDLRKVFDYTNYVLNVGNYIVPAIKTGLINKIYGITGEEDLFKYKDFEISEDYILNLDLDFFSQELDYIDFELKKKVILDFAKNAKLITISTSPFFIDQNLAIKVLKNIFTPGGR